jgi:hypothetical protein
MRVPLISVLLIAGLMSGCAGRSSTRPVEVLDDRTGLTFSALQEPIELVPSAHNAALVSRLHTSLAYLGPVEWNRSGTLSYSLWVHIAPGIDLQPGDIHAPGAVTLILADGPLALTPAEAPMLGRGPYRQAAPWGQTAYFDLTVERIRRMAARPKLELDVRAADGSVMAFSPTLDTAAILTRYLRDRGITGD